MVRPTAKSHDTDGSTASASSPRVEAPAIATPSAAVAAAPVAAAEPVAAHAPLVTAEAPLATAPVAAEAPLAAAPVEVTQSMPPASHAPAVANNAPEDPTRTSQRTHGAASLPLADIPVAAQLRDPKRYRILGEHGRGGLGRVARAHDVDLGRDIAIKELISRGPISEVRFLREALITARLEHPGIVPVHEAGRWLDGTD